VRWDPSFASRFGLSGFCLPLPYLRFRVKGSGPRATGYGLRLPLPLVTYPGSQYPCTLNRNTSRKWMRNDPGPRATGCGRRAPPPRFHVEQTLRLLFPTGHGLRLLRPYACVPGFCSRRTAQGLLV
jgi:hypothetical protein